MTFKLRLIINETVYHAELPDNKLTRQITSLCPFEAGYQRSAECEYFTRLPDIESASGCEKTTIAYKNKLYYFDGWNAFSIVFADCDIAPYEIVYLGDFQEDIAKQLKNEGSAVHILCELEK
jgi:hypothetical protein